MRPAPPRIADRSEKLQGGKLVNLKSKLSVRGPVAIAVSIALAAPALAQEAPANSAATPAQSDTLQEVVVQGFRQVMQSSLAAKRQLNLISDDITTADIGQLPDITIAEELDRLPGVSMIRDRGNDSIASIRGLGPRLVLGLVNGREVASPNPDQSLRWEIFPSAVLSGLSVYKTQDASLVPGGIAATVDIKTISPIDYHGPKFTLDLGPEYNDLGKSLPHYDPLGYRADVGYITHVSDTLAFDVTAAVQRQKNGYPDFRTWGWNTPFNSGSNKSQPDGTNTGDLNGDGIPDNTTYGLNTELKEIAEDRRAVTSTVAWRPSDALTLKWDGLYTEYHIFERDFQAWYGNNILGNWDNGNASIYNAPGSSYRIVNDTVVAANLYGANSDYESVIANYNEKSSLLATGINAAWKAGVWSGSVDLSYSQAKLYSDWEAMYLSDVTAPNLIYDVQAGQKPYALTPGFDPANPAIQSVGGHRNNPGAAGVDGTGTNGPLYGRDSLGALTLDFTRTLDNPVLTTLQFGARASARTKTNQSYGYGLCAGSGSTVFPIPYDQNSGSQVCPGGQAVISLANAGLEEFNLPDITAPPMVYGNFNALRPMVYPNDAVPAGSENLLAHSRVTEQTYDGYVMADFAGHLLGRPVTGDAGVRVSRVSTLSHGFSSPDKIHYSPVKIGNDFTDVLPSMNAIWHLADDKLLRFGASIAVSRPPLDALTTGFTLQNTQLPYTGSGGNPKLREYKADNLDVSYEWYFHEESMLAVAPYWKHLTSIIGGQQAIENIAGTDYLVNTQDNAPGGNVEGVELSFQTRFFFLPGLLQHFGIYGNYAYLHSNVHELSPLPNPFPMVGLAKSISELDLDYEQGGFEARVDWKYHGPFTAVPTWTPTALKTLAAENVFDASASYSFDPHWSVRLQALNLTNERTAYSVDNNPENLANDQGYQLYGRTYNLVVSLRL